MTTLGCIKHPYRPGDVIRGTLIYLAESGRTKWGDRLVRYRCDRVKANSEVCGNEGVGTLTHILCGVTTSCGCARSDAPKSDARRKAQSIARRGVPLSEAHKEAMRGEKSHHWIAYPDLYQFPNTCLKYRGEDTTRTPSHNRRIVVECDCGTIFSVYLSSIRQHNTTSCGHKRVFHYKDGSMRSMSEVRTAEILDELGIQWEYEKHQVQYTLADMRAHSYTPDFKIDGLFLEVKGELNLECQVKMSAVRDQHADLKLVMVFDQPRNKISKGSRVTYAQWAQHTGYPWISAKDLSTFLQEWKKEGTAC